MIWMKSVLLIGNFVSHVFAAAPATATGNDSHCIGVNGLSPKCRPVEAAHHREVYYVGGRYEVNASTGLQSLIDQVYVEKLTPNYSRRQPYPLFFFHGGGYSGTVSTCRRLIESSHTSNTRNCGVGLVTDTGWQTRNGLLFPTEALPGLSR